MKAHEREKVRRASKRKPGSPHRLNSGLYFPPFLAIVPTPPGVGFYGSEKCALNERGVNLDTRNCLLSGFPSSLAFRFVPAHPAPPRLITRRPGAAAATNALPAFFGNCERRCCSTFDAVFSG